MSNGSFIFGAAMTTLINRPLLRPLETHRGTESLSLTAKLPFTARRVRTPLAGVAVIIVTKDKREGEASRTKPRLWIFSSSNNHWENTRIKGIIQVLHLVIQLCHILILSYLLLPILITVVQVT